MDRRDFCFATPLLLAGCGNGGDMAREYELQPSPIRQATKSATDIGVRGEWTPTVGGTATYTEQTGTYVRIMNLAFIHCTLWISNIGTGSQNLISGLPFPSTNRKNVLSVEITGSLSQNVVDVIAYVTEDEGPTNPQSIFVKSMTVADNAHSENNILTSGTVINISGFYEIQF